MESVSVSSEMKTLWMGDIQMNWDENFITSLFATGVEQPIIKLIRDKVTGYPAGYCFLEFPTQGGAQAVLEAFNGQPIANTMQRFRLNWGGAGRRAETGDDHSIFVGDLAPDVNDEVLLNTFTARFASIRGAKVVMDPVTRMSKGFGFVRFGSKEEADQALQTMNGVYCSSRPMRVSVATDRSGKARMGGGIGQQYGNEDDMSNNTTVFIGGLDASTSDEDLRARFSPFGDIVSIKVPPGRGCGFVQYASKESAETAIAQMNGTTIGNAKVRCAWGRAAATRTGGASQANSGYYQQQYPSYQQQGYMNYYGYGNYYQQPYPPNTGNYGGYGGYGGGYHQGYPQQQGHQGGAASHQNNQQENANHAPRDFTKQEDPHFANRRYVSQRGYQHMPPAPSAAYNRMSSDPSKGTAMAGHT